MKTLSIVLILIQVLSANSKACNSNNDAINSVIDLAEQVEELVDTDEKFSQIDDLSLKAQKELSSRAMKPVSPKRVNDYNEVGVLQLSDIGNKSKFSATGFKISNKCVLTSAHFLYESTSESTDLNKNKGFEGRIDFVRGGSINKSVKAKVFYQMTKENEDFTVSNSTKRTFFGHNDLIILRLAEGDNNFRKVSVVDPSEFKYENKEIGRKITCQGMPRHMTEQSYGTCKGTSFLWEQKNARVFIDDKEKEKQGLISNLASTKGMSGGPCSLIDNPNNEVFGLVSNGFSTDSHGNYNMPALKFKNENYINQGARYLSLLHILDKRMRAELGYGLDKIAENCDK